MDTEPNPALGKKRTQRIDLGLAISGATMMPGQVRSHEEIAAFCDCSRERIFQIEKQAMRKLRHRLRIAMGDEYGDFCENDLQ